MKFFGFGVVLFLVSQMLSAQPTVGTTGLLNIPTAEMQRDGTFILGGNYLPDPITPEYFNYNTGNYYFNITFLPFLEVSYKLTLLKVSQNKFNQDRSVAVRVRLFQEKKILPAIVCGMDDVYSSSESGNHFFKSFYVVATKNFNWKPIHISATIGQRAESVKSFAIDGLFGGLAVNPIKLDGLKLMAEYDSKVFNAGASLLLFHHLKIQAFAYDMKYWAGGIQYRIFIN